MNVNIVIDYMVLSVATYLGVAKELSEYANELADTWRVDQEDAREIKQVRIGKLNFKRRPIVGDRSNTCEIRLERLG